MDLTKLNDILAKEPSFRLAQAKEAVFRDLAENWSEVKTLPIDLRKELDKKCPLRINVEASVGKEESVKALVTLKDNLKVETVLMRHKGGRNTVCVSSQVGCSLACVFCATGKQGFKRNLKSMEIVEQVLFFGRYLKTKQAKITNIVFMGMGEPFLNYDNVLAAIRILNDKEGFNLGARHFSISTVGIKEGILKLKEEKLQVNLAISLHAPNDKLRLSLMPIDKKHPIKEVMEATEDYTRTTKRRVMIEYVMIRDVNDSDSCARDLAKLVKKPLLFVNLISYNPTGIFESSKPERIKRFKEILESQGITVTQRYRFGQDVRAACGQLAGK